MNIQEINNWPRAKRKRLLVLVVLAAAILLGMIWLFSFSAAVKNYSPSKIQPAGLWSSLKDMMQAKPVLNPEAQEPSLRLRLDFSKQAELDKVKLPLLK